MRQIKTRTLESGSEKGFITGSYKEMGGSCTKNPDVTESFQQAPLKAKREAGSWLVVANFLMPDLLLLSHSMVR